MLETTSAVALTIPSCRSNEDAGFPVNSRRYPFRAPVEQNITWRGLADPIGQDRLIVPWPATISTARGMANDGYKEILVARTALIVDDSASVRQMISFTLREAGFEVLEGVNGRDALAALEGKRVDVIITDLNMPIMDGIEFIRAARARTETKFTPILMLTTESHIEKRQAAKGAGATGWIVKPFQPAQLLQVIGRVLP